MPELQVLCDTVLKIKSVLDRHTLENARSFASHRTAREPQLHQLPICGFLDVNPSPEKGNSSFKGGNSYAAGANSYAEEGAEEDDSDMDDLFSQLDPDDSIDHSSSTSSFVLPIQSSQVEVERCLLENGLDVDVSSDILDMERFNTMVSPVDDNLEFLDDRFTLLHDYLYDLEGVDPEMIRQVSDNEIMKCLEQLSEPSNSEQDFCNTIQATNGNVVEAFLSQGKDHSLPFLKKARRNLEKRNIFISEKDWNFIRSKRLKFRRQKKYKSKCLDQRRQDVMAKILNLFENKHSITLHDIGMNMKELRDMASSQI